MGQQVVELTNSQKGKSFISDSCDQNHKPQRNMKVNKILEAHKHNNIRGSACSLYLQAKTGQKFH